MVDGAPIIYVEDDPDVCELACSLADELGLDLIVEPEGIPAIDTIASHPDSIVLLDLELPDMDGAKILARFPGREIIVFSGSNRDPKQLPGARGVVNKPTDADEFTACLRSLLLIATAPVRVDVEELRRTSSRFPGGAERLYVYASNVLETAEETCHQLEALLKVGDARGISDAVHRLAPHVGILGSRSMHAVLQEVETIARDNGPALEVATAMALRHWAAVQPGLQEGLDALVVSA